MSRRDRPWWRDLAAELEAAAVATATGAELQAWVDRFGFTMVSDGAGGVMTLIAPGSLYAPRDEGALPRGRSH